MSALGILDDLRARPGVNRGSYLAELNSAAVLAGITAFIWYAVGLVPVQIAVTGQFGLTTGFCDVVVGWAA